MDASTAKQKASADFFTVYISKLLDITYQYFSIFFGTIFETLGTIFGEFVHFFVGIFTDIFKILKKTILDFLDKFVFPYSLYPVWNVLKKVFFAIFENLTKLLTDIFGPIFRDGTYKYVLAFFIYLIAIIFYNSSSKPTSGAASFEIPAAAAAIPKEAAGDKNAAGILSWINPISWLLYFGKFIFIFIYTIIFAFVYFGVTITNPNSFSRFAWRVVKFFPLYLIFWFISYLLIMTFLSDKITLKNIYILVPIIVGVVFIYEIFDVVQATIGRLIALIFNFFVRPKDPIIDTGASPPGALGDVMRVVNETMIAFGEFIKVFTDWFEEKMKFMKEHFTGIGLMESAEFVYILASSLVFIAFLFFMYFYQNTTKIYNFMMFAYVLFMLPMIYKAFQYNTDVLKNIVAFVVGIISILIMYITNFNMKKNDKYQPTPEQDGDKTVFNILFIVYSAVLVFFVNVRLLSPNFKESALFLYSLVHVLFLIGLIAYSINYKTKLRNRIDKSSDPSSDMSATANSSADAVDPVEISTAGISALPSSINTVSAIDNTSPHEQMYRT